MNPPGDGLIEYRDTGRSLPPPADRDEEIVQGAYDRGFADGLAAYAWWKDGVQYVGTTGRTLADALALMTDTWNYTP